MLDRASSSAIFCLVTVALGFGVTATSTLSLASDPAPETLVEKADAVRNPSQSYKMTVSVRTPDAANVFDVYVKGTSSTLIVTREPARDRGRNMLMIDRDFYAYIPSLKRSVRLSLAQKLMGQVANGDIARTRWAGDYSVKIEATEGKENRLLLDGRKPGLTYQKIRLWLAAKTSRPARAEFLSVDGKTVLKRAWYEKYKTLAGAERPSVIRIEDANHQTSTIEVSEMKSTDLKDAFFTEQNMESYH